MFGAWSYQVVDIRQSRRIIAMFFGAGCILLLLTHGTVPVWRCVGAFLGAGVATMLYVPVQRLTFPLKYATTICTGATFVGIVSTFAALLFGKPSFFLSAAVGFVGITAILVADRMRSILRDNAA